MDSGLSHVGPHAVDSVQVVKGPYALTWGAGALAAVRLETYRPPFSDAGFTQHGRAGARYGDNGDVTDLFARAAGSGERWRYSLLAGRRSGGDYEAGDGATVPGDFTSSEARLHLGFQAAEGLLLGVEGGYQDQHDLDYAGRLLDATYFQTRSYAGRLDWAPSADGVDEVSLLLYANRKDHRMNNDEKPTARPLPGRVPPFGLDVDLPTESNTSGGRAALSGRRDGLTWSAGADAYRLRQNARRTISRRDNGAVLFRDVVWPDAELDDGGLWTQVVHRGGASTVATTLRYDRWSADAGQAVSPFFVAAAGDPTPRDENLWSAAVSGRLRLGDAWSLEAGLGRAVRTPTALELYSDRFPSSRFQVAAEFVGDPRLDPETAWQADLGASYAAGGVQASVSTFYRRLDDNVTVRPDPTLPRRLPLSPMQVYRYVNGSRAAYVGVEARLDARLSDAWALRAAGAWLRGDDEGLDEPAFGVAAPWLSTGVRWQGGSLRGGSAGGGPWADLGVRWVDRQDRVARARLERPTPGYTVVDLAAGWRFGERWQLAAGADNLLDESYADHLSSLDPFTGERVPEPGRSLYARLEVGF
jgi:iron complex outermembrane receptor protein